MVNDILREGAKELSQSQTPLLDARVLLSEVLHENVALVHRELTKEETVQFNKFISLRKQGVPVSYITGRKEFMGYDFFVNESTLIPRPDTECLVEKIIELFPDFNGKILDLCTGSGCIGISLALFLKGATVQLCDISADALTVAKRNIEKHKLQSRVKAYTLDAIKDPYPREFDIITANPPYIPYDRLINLEVAKYEPRSALLGGNDGLDFYRAIIPKACLSLKPGGILALEIGYDQAKGVTSLMNNYRGVCVFKDYGNNDRVVIGYKRQD